MAIGSIEVLAKTLGLHPRYMMGVIDKVDDSYTLFTLPSHPKTKKIRTVCEAKFTLKRIQKRINSRIFSNIKFPSYLQGGLKATENQNRDYIENAKIHAGAVTLINLDVRNFYPNIKTKAVKNVFKYFFKFEDKVVDALVKLTTYRGSIPQGAATSSYIANLVFFNTEYQLVSKLRGQGINYTRLLDDITISSRSELSNEKSSEIITLVSGMMKKHDLKLHNKKTNVCDRRQANADFQVTGLWVKHGIPKVRKKERRYVRQLVYNCEQEAKVSKTCERYHTLWNRTSGHVNTLFRLNHSQSKDYRLRLKCILPEYDDAKVSLTCEIVKSLLKVPKQEHQKLNFMNRFNLVMYQLGIVARTHKSVASSHKKQLRAHCKNVTTKAEFWES